MHIVMFADQHAEALGGAQVSVRLQRRCLERAGHTVSIVAPRRVGVDASAGRDDPAYVDLPAIGLTRDREYSITWPGRRTDPVVDRAMSGRPAPDIVHIQAEFWGALLGYRYASRHRLPMVQTMHSRIDAGLQATTSFSGVLVPLLNTFRRLALRGYPGGAAEGTDVWAYLRALAGSAQAVTAPSAHYARRLREHDVFDRIDVIWNGIDDEVLDQVLAGRPAVRRPGRPRLVWAGRLSAEKRVLPFLRAVADADIDADIEVIGDGGQLEAARRLAEDLGLAGTVRMSGRIAYADALRRIADADALVQTSIGFETQGMTVFEAASFGVPSVLSDPDIAAELGSGSWLVEDASAEADRVPALAAALRRAVCDIRGGTAPKPPADIGERFRQSSRTEAMIEVYERVLAAHRAARS
ncbi:MAG TPA: glycosyltransferase [Microbacterium sp.]|nr:glycosyltransferase [Microbacterium sp.]